MAKSHCSGPWFPSAMNVTLWVHLLACSLLVLIVFLDFVHLHTFCKQKTRFRELDLLPVSDEVVMVICVFQLFCRIFVTSIISPSVSCDCSYEMHFCYLVLFVCSLLRPNIRVHINAYVFSFLRRILVPYHLFLEFSYVYMFYSFTVSLKSG